MTNSPFAKHDDVPPPTKDQFKHLIANDCHCAWAAQWMLDNGYYRSDQTTGTSDQPVPADD